MEYIHSKQRVLCNLTARSCLIGSNNAIKLFKFSLSCQVQRGMDHARVQSTTIMPLKWMAPEVPTCMHTTIYAWIDLSLGRNFFNHCMYVVYH